MYEHGNPLKKGQVVRANHNAISSVKVRKGALFRIISTHDPNRVRIAAFNANDIFSEDFKRCVVGNARELSFWATTSELEAL